MHKTEYQFRLELHKTPYPLLAVIQKGHYCSLIDCRLNLPKERTKYMQHRCIHILARSRSGCAIWNKVYQTSDYEDAVEKLTEILGAST